MNRQREAAWKGAGTSLLLHLVAGMAVIVTLSGPPKAPVQVIDLTLLPPGEPGSPPFPAASAAVKPATVPGTAAPAGSIVLPETAALPETNGPSVAQTDPNPSAFPPLPPAAAPSEGIAQGIPQAGPAGTENAHPSGPPYSPAATQAAVGIGTFHAAEGGAAASAGAGSAAGDFAWIRDAIQQAIAYPATARRMGWEGKVVVAFRLLPDGSVRDVRVVQGSGHAALDRGAIDAVRSASPFPRARGEAEILTPVVFFLTPLPRPHDGREGKGAR